MFEEGEKVIFWVEGIERQRETSFFLLANLFLKTENVRRTPMKAPFLENIIFSLKNSSRNKLNYKLNVQIVKRKKKRKKKSSGESKKHLCKPTTSPC